MNYARSARPVAAFVRCKFIYLSKHPTKREMILGASRGRADYRREYRPGNNDICAPVARMEKGWGYADASNSGTRLSRAAIRARFGQVAVARYAKVHEDRRTLAIGDDRRLSRERSDNSGIRGGGVGERRSVSVISVMIDAIRVDLV